MQFKRYLTFPIILFLILSFSSKASGGLILDLGFKVVYEDNLLGYPAESRKIGTTMGSRGMLTGAQMNMGSQNMSGSETTSGDFYTVLTASIGHYSDINDFRIFLTGDGEAYLFNKYDNLNFSIVGISTGIYRGFSNIFSGQLALKGMLKDYKDQTDSNAYAASLIFKEQITPLLWIKEGYEYEKNNSNSPSLNYDKHLFSLWAGYVITEQTTINLGYNYLIRIFDNSTKVRFHTISTALVFDLTKNISTNIGYDYQIVDSDASDFRNNIYTFGVTYHY